MSRNIRTMLAMEQHGTMVAYHRLMRTLFLAMVGVSLFSACGVSKSEAADDGAGAGDASTVQGFTTGFCNSFKACCAEAGFKTDGVQCLFLVSAAFAGQEYDATAGATCLDWLETASAGGKVCPNTDQAPAACGLAVKSSGTRAPGETCASGNDCAPSAEGPVSCAFGFTNDMELMKCQLQLPGTVGSSPCVATRDGNVEYFVGVSGDVPAKGYVCDRAQGLYCDGAACTTISNVGGPCTGSSDCVTGTYCDYSLGTCAAPKPLGAVCTPYGEDCGPDNYCPPTTMICTTALSAGAACTSSSACRSQSCVNGACEGNDTSDAGLALLCGE